MLNILENLSVVCLFTRRQSADSPQNALISTELHCLQQQDFNQNTYQEKSLDRIKPQFLLCLVNKFF